MFRCCFAIWGPIQWALLAGIYSWYYFALVDNTFKQEGTLYEQNKGYNIEVVASSVGLAPTAFAAWIIALVLVCSPQGVCFKAASVIMMMFVLIANLVISGYVLYYSYLFFKPLRGWNAYCDTGQIPGSDHPDVGGDLSCSNSYAVYLSMGIASVLIALISLTFALAIVRHQQAESLYRKAHEPKYRDSQEPPLEQKQVPVQTPYQQQQQQQPPPVQVPYQQQPPPAATVPVPVPAPAPIPTPVQTQTTYNNNNDQIQRRIVAEDEQVFMVPPASSVPTTPPVTPPLTPSAPPAPTTPPTPCGTPPSVTPPVTPPHTPPAPPPRFAIVVDEEGAAASQGVTEPVECTAVKLQ